MFFLLISLAFYSFGILLYFSVHLLCMWLKIGYERNNDDIAGDKEFSRYRKQVLRDINRYFSDMSIS